MTEDRYQSYQETPVKWLKTIPSHWEVRKLKFLATIQNGQDYKNVEAEFGESSYPVFGSGGAFTKASQFLYDGESVLFGRKGTIDKPLHIHEKFWTVDTMFYSHLHADTNGRYFYYQATTIQYSLIATQTALPSITQFDLSNYFLCFPPLPEQTQIARFLDYKTAQLDQLIAQKQALIERLNEQRIALITQAVTRGLNPAAPLKNSGLEWLGQVPKGWEVKRLRFLSAGIEQGWSPQCDANPAEDDQWGVLKVGCVNGNELDPLENKALPGSLDAREEYEIQPGDILISRANTKELLGSAAIVPATIRKQLLLCDKLYRLKPAEEIDPEFLVFVLRTPIARYQYEREATGASGSMQNIGQDTIKNLTIPVPPFTEQQAIVEQLKADLVKKDKMLSLTEDTIARLEEYRTALITAAVTGKIDVRGFKLPETAHDA
tara:strand:- start:157 stop:1458 length:1302 start_codon:yes stop_codon:yes gene_type:complete